MDYEIVSLGEEQQPVSPPPTQPTSSLGTIARGAGGLALRAGESLLGLPGDIAQGIGGLAEAGVKKLTGVSPTEVHQKLSSFLGLKPITDYPVPTSEYFHGLTKKITGETFEPKSGTEQQLQEFVATAAPMMFGGVSAGRAIGSAAIGQLAKFAAQEIGIPEGFREPIKAGAMLATSLVGIPSMKSFAKNLYEEAQSSLPEAMNIPAKGITEHLNSLEQAIGARSFPNKKILIENIESVGSAINPLSKTIPAKQLWDIKKDVNEWLRNPSLRKSSTVKNKLAELSSLLGDTLIKETAEIAPEFSTSLKRADNIWRTLHGTEEATTVIGSALQKIKKSVTPITLSVLGYLFPSKVVSGATVLGASKLGSSAINALKTSINNPGVRHYYAKMLEGALKNNQQAVIKAAKHFDTALQKAVPQGQEDGDYELISLGD